ncbi:hypothetical protein SAMN05421823_102561 [Catalinimonas alkaloidigena]|uniref:Uncharacterized protein n=1 Tax=Catalinimonas alkaloidigena TaxID=1075417 RepID=A0A1G9B9Y6_9BACT|nr:hypothetical protein [Catalinimonas alkaloidigena]SDK36386.1 hypothetical protein SAMN05421823_102561 [Catalinimonas alkaloidigena]
MSGFSFTSYLIELGFKEVRVDIYRHSEWDVTVQFLGSKVLITNYKPADLQMCSVVDAKPTSADAAMHLLTRAKVQFPQLPLKRNPRKNSLLLSRV